MRRGEGTEQDMQWNEASKVGLSYVICDGGGGRVEIISCDEENSRW